MNQQVLLLHSDGSPNMDELQPILYCAAVVTVDYKAKRPEALERRRLEQRILSKRAAIVGFERIRKSAFCHQVSY